jgi:peptidoglycan/LPS O-acetylase OafA/YrhL
VEQRAQDHADPARPPRGREPALDGLRALAVLAVVAFHGEAGWATGGFLGVDIFFVLSGFLITRLLLIERGTTGGVDLRGFWGRRARRLLPALLVLIAGLFVLGLVADLPHASLQTLPGDALAALLFVANWRFLAGDHGYFASGQAPSLLEHTWSLSIEEQFYLLWAPLLAALAVVVARRATSRSATAAAAGGAPGAGSARRSTARLVLALALAGAAASAAWMWFRAGSSGSDSAYWDTLARLQGPLIGAALAVVLASSRTTAFAARVRWLPGALAATGLVVLGILVVRLDAGSDLLYPTGFVLAAVATAAVIAGLHLHPTGAVARGLGWRPIAALGVISYGVYLWHWPMLFVVTGASTGLSGVAVHALRLVVTIAVATASYLIVEKPVLQTRGSLGRTALVFGACGAAVVLALAVLLPVPDPATVDTELAIPGAEAFVAPSGMPTIGTAPPSDRAPLVTIASGQPGTSSPAAPTTTSPAPTTVPEVTAPPTTVAIAPSTVPGPPVRISFFGDSVSDSLANALAPEGGRYNTVVSNAALIGCGVPTTGPYRLGGAEHELSGECVEWQSVWEQGIADQRPDLAVIVLGRHEVLDRQYDETWTAIGDPSYDGYLLSQLGLAIGLVRQHGIPVVVTTAPFYVGPADPGGGIRPENAPSRVHRFNQLLRTAAGDDPAVRVVDLGGLVSPTGTYIGSIDGVRIRSDGVHFAREAGPWLAPRLLPQLVETVR